MQKTNTLRYIRNSIFLIVFNALFFVIGGIEHNASAWMSYVFIHFAYFMLLATPLLIRKGKSESVYRFTLYSISAVYLIIELIIGVTFIIVSPENYKIALLIQLPIAGLYGITLVFHLIANEYTTDAEEGRQHQIAYVKDASVKLKGLLDGIGDKEAKKAVEKVYDAVYSSPVKSLPNLTQIENHILQSIKELESTVSTGDKENIVSLAHSLLTAVNERNMLLQSGH